MKRFTRLPEKTEDGSFTLYIPEMDEHYHSTHGAIVEADHVYIKTALLHHMDKSNAASQISLLEIGFGTGLNAFLTMLQAIKLKRTIHYTTLELYPLNTEITDQLNYAEQIMSHKEYLAEGMDEATVRSLFQALHHAKWDEPVAITEYFTLHKRQFDLVNDDLDGAYDVLYYDAFAPDKQPDMWTDPIFTKVCSCMLPLAVLSTYCAKGVVRRAFQAQGFTMERLAGPPGKREIIRGTKSVGE